MPKRALPYKRERFFATPNEQKVILWLREFAWNDVISESISKSIHMQLDMLERRKAYMKQEGEQNTEEYEKITLSIGMLEIFHVRWSELIKELTAEK